MELAYIKADEVHMAGLSRDEAAAINLYTQESLVYRRCAPSSQPLAYKAPHNEERVDTTRRGPNVTARLFHDHRCRLNFILRDKGAARLAALQPYMQYMKLLMTALLKVSSVGLATIWRGVKGNFRAHYKKGDVRARELKTVCVQEP